MGNWTRTVFSASIIGVVLASTLIGCHKVGETTVGASSGTQPTNGNANSMVADISGDVSMHLVAAGDDVQIGFLPTAKKGEWHFSISGSKLQGTQRIEVNPGISGAFHLTPGIAQDAGGGRFNITQEDGGTGDQDKKYDPFTYMLYFNTQPGSPSLGHITLIKADKVASQSALLARYHLVGTFQYVAATAPKTPSNSCTHEMLAYVAAHGERLPQYNAALCEAKSVTVSGSFDVVQDFPALAF